MPTYRNVRREPDDIPDLAVELAERTNEVAKALRAADGNTDDRAYKNADFLRLRAERQLAAAQRRANERARLLNLTPSEIVDKATAR